jgi:hypothetical protein
VFHRVLHLACLALLMAASLYAEDDTRLHPSGGEAFAGFDEPSSPGRAAGSIVMNSAPRALSRGQIQNALATRSVFATASSNFRSLRGGKRSLSNSRQSANSAFGAQSRAERGYRAPVAPVDSARRLLASVSVYQGGGSALGGTVDVGNFVTSAGSDKDGRSHKIDYSSAVGFTGSKDGGGFFISTSNPSGSGSGSGSGGAAGGGAGGGAGSGSGGGGVGGSGGPFGNANGGTNGGGGNSGGNSGGSSGGGSSGGSSGGASSSGDNREAPVSDDDRKKFNEAVNAIRNSMADGKRPTREQLAALKTPQARSIFRDGGPSGDRPGDLYEYFAAFADRKDGKLTYTVGTDKIELRPANNADQRQEAMRAFYRDATASMERQNGPNVPAKDRVSVTSAAREYLKGLERFDRSEPGATEPELTGVLQKTMGLARDAENNNGTPPASGNPGDSGKPKPVPQRPENTA